MPIITLISDFGIHDPAAGALKGILLGSLPAAQIIDISHEVPPFDRRQAAYLLDSAYRHFPAGTIHLVCVDIYADHMPRLVAAYYDGQFFLAPDNGIIPMAFPNATIDAWLCFELSNTYTFYDWQLAAAQEIRRLSQSQGSGTPKHQLINFLHHIQQVQPGIFACSVIYIDQYGNVVTDMTLATFEALNRSGRFMLTFMRVNEITAISKHYSDVTSGESLCRFNSSGHLEICVNQGNAAVLFGFRSGGIHNDIKITFG
jgi:S-adenosylmethionine hydrolase